MKLFNPFSTLALVSLLFNLVAARPYKNHNGGGRTVTSSFTSRRIATSTSTDTADTAAPIPSALRSHRATSTSKSASASPTSTSKYPPLDYSVVKSYSGGSFFDQFNFYTGEDPTHGFVEYDSPLNILITVSSIKGQRRIAIWFTNQMASRILLQIQQTLLLQVVKVSVSNQKINLMKSSLLRTLLISRARTFILVNN
jgi:hypothetical protein